MAASTLRTAPSRDVLAMSFSPTQQPILPASAIKSEQRPAPPASASAPTHAALGDRSALMMGMPMPMDWRASNSALVQHMQHQQQHMSSCGAKQVSPFGQSHMPMAPAATPAGYVMHQPVPLAPMNRLDPQQLHTASILSCMPFGSSSGFFPSPWMGGPAGYPGGGSMHGMGMMGLGGITAADPGLKNMALLSRAAGAHGPVQHSMLNLTGKGGSA
jgi:hypothetical protein